MGSRGLVLLLHWWQVSQSWGAPSGMQVKLCWGHLNRGVALWLWDRDEVLFVHRGSRPSWGHAVLSHPPQTLCQGDWSVAPPASCAAH